MSEKIHMITHTRTPKEKNAEIQSNVNNYNC